jgi:hypothetical protein
MSPSWVSAGGVKYIFEANGAQELGENARVVQVRSQHGRVLRRHGALKFNLF